MSRKVGCLHLYLAEMAASKTTTLLLRGKAESAIAGTKVLYSNSVMDTRSDSFFSSHGDALNPDFSGIVGIKVKRLSELPQGYDVYLIDEGQFDDDIVEEVYRMVLVEKKFVIVAALMGDTDLQPMGKVFGLLPLVAPRGLFRLVAKCERCIKEGVPRENADAGYTRLRDGRSKSSSVDIGGLEMYEPCCLYHHPISHQSDA